MDKSVSIDLQVSDWNVVMNALGGRPFAEVAELVNKIRQQADAQLREAEAAVSE